MANDKDAAKAYSAAKEAGRKVTYERKATIKKEKKGGSSGGGSKASAQAQLPDDMVVTIERKGGGNGLIWSLVLMLLAISLAFGIFLAFFFNIGGIKTYTAEAFLKEDNFYKTRLETIDAQIQDYEAKVAEVSARQAQLEQIQTDLDKREQELNAREEKLNKRASDLDGKEENVSAYTLQREQLIATLSKIDTKSAAKILENMEVRLDAAKLLKDMDVKTSAAILEAMSTDASAEITQLMLIPMP